MEVDKILERRDKLRNLVDEFKCPPNETVYEQSVRYGQIAYKTFQLMLEDKNVKFVGWEFLSEEDKLIYIEVANQIEKITLKENDWTFNCG